ncbi:hypothetical protein [Agrobacterium cavarae]|uniref:hypothetical protein n=1 Tax=Agrobacterium cavarae TaxID=2528239 RepID=UPI002FFC49E7
MSLHPIEITRARLEAKIEELIALLDLVDGDENLEPWLADDDPENGDSEFDDERQPNGDEQDTSFCEDDNYGVYLG